MGDEVNDGSMNKASMHKFSYPTLNADMSSACSFLCYTFLIPVKLKGEKLLIKIDYGWYWDYKHNKAIELVTEYTVIPSLFLAFTQ